MPLGKKTALAFLLAIIVLTALILPGCSHAPRNAGEIPDPGFTGDDQPSKPADPAPGDGTGGNQADEDPGEHIVYQGSLQIVVDDTRKTALDIQKLAEEAGGFVSDSYVYALKENLYAAQIKLRIPARRFQPVMLQLQDMGKAGDIRQNSNNVTMEYVEYESRLNNLRSQEQRLQEILDMAGTVEEVLNIEKELWRIRGEIEVLVAQFNYLQDQVDYATITVNVREEAIRATAISPAPFDNIGERMLEIFNRSINFILAAAATALLFLTGSLPVALLLAIIIILIRAIFKYRRKKRDLSS